MGDGAGRGGQSEVTDRVKLTAHTPTHTHARSPAWKQKEKKARQPERWARTTARDRKRAETRCTQEQNKRLEDEDEEDETQDVEKTREGGREKVKTRQEGNAQEAGGGRGHTDLRKQETPVQNKRDDHTHTHEERTKRSSAQPKINTIQESGQKRRIENGRRRRRKEDNTKRGEGGRGGGQ